MDSLKSYDEWHASMEIDYDADTPWHIFFRDNESSMDFTNTRILEIGCGRGGFANYFLSKYSNTISSYNAVDYSTEAVRKGREYIGNRYTNVTIETGDIQNIHFGDNTFDFVFSFETIEHVPSPDKAVSELNRVLKKTGKLVLTTPNYLGFFGLYRVYLRLKGRRWTEAGQPINKFVLMPRTIYWLRKAGFHVLRSDSQIISCPSPFSSKVINFNWINPRFIFKWFGLQSFFIAEK
jgi:SAM-dependent methyltransferase